MSNFHAPTCFHRNKQQVSQTSFTILPAPFHSVVVISATQHQQAQQRVVQIDQEVRSAGVKIRLIEDGLTDEEKQRYPTVMEELTPLYAKINRLVPFYYFVTKNSDKAARDMLTMKYIIQQQFIALPEEKYIISLGALIQHKQLLAELAKYENQIQKLQTSGGYAACQIAFDSAKDASESTESKRLQPQQIQNGDTTFSGTIDSQPLVRRSTTPPINFLTTGGATLAKFLTMVESYDPLDDTSSRVGDLFVSTENIDFHQSRDSGKDWQDGQEIGMPKKNTNGIRQREELSITSSIAVLTADTSHGDTDVLNNSAGNSRQREEKPS